MTGSPDFTPQPFSFALAGGKVMRGLCVGSSDEKAPPLLALHGWLDNAHSFLPLLPHLRGYRLYALELVGHGHSDHRSADASYCLLSWLRDLCVFCEAQRWPRFYLMGHSMGAALAALLGGTLPHRIARLVLLDGIGAITKEDAHLPGYFAEHVRAQEQKTKRGLKVYRSSEEAAVTLAKVVKNLSLPAARLLVERNLKPAPGGAGLVWRSDPRLRDLPLNTLTEGQLSAFYHRIAAPTLFVRPTSGLAFAPHELAQRQGYIKDLSIHTLPGGHHVHMDEPEEVGALLREFFVGL